MLRSIIDSYTLSNFVDF